MRNNVKDKVVLITGASSGIGMAAAVAFSKAGAIVAAAARRKSKLDELAASYKNVFSFPTDISDVKQAEAMIEKTVKCFGRIDVLINNAAAIIVSPLMDIKPEDMEKSFKTNVIGPMAATNRAAYYMIRQGGGQIINVGSPGFMIGIPYYGPYASSKGAVTGWTRTMQAEWADSCIVVSEYFPGYIETGSPAESRMGPVPQDAVIDQHQNVLTKFFTRPKTPEYVAGQLVSLVEKPEILVYTGFTERLGSWIINFSGRRIAIARGMAKAAGKRLNIKPFKQ